MPPPGPSLALTIPRWRGVLHAWAFVVSVPLGLGLVVAASSTRAAVGAAVFAASLTALLGTSAAYHRLARSPRARLVLGRLDHSMIYVLIAGSYTPLCLLAQPTPWAVALLATVWGGAALGIVLKGVGFASLASLANGLYIALGWAGLAGLPLMLATVPAPGLVLLLLGGVAYTVGAVVFSRGRPDPVPAVFGYHEVWHACTLVGAGSHWGVVLLLVRA